MGELQSSIEVKLVAQVTEERIASGRGTLLDPAQVPHLAVGTLVTCNLSTALKLYREAFGFECVEYAPGRALARDRRAKYLMQNGGRDFFLLDLTEVRSVDHPQAVHNHWGLSVGSVDEVTRIHEALTAKQSEYGLKQIRTPAKMHGSFGFYFVDGDDNWWEIECRAGIFHEELFAKGDWDDPDRESFPHAAPRSLEIAPIASVVVGPEAFLTHGTAAIRDTHKPRGLYEKVLGLRFVRHNRAAGLMAGAGDFAVVNLRQMAVQDQGQENRFVILLDNEAALEAMQARATETAEEFGVLSISGIERTELGGRSFLMRTWDHIWFEISTRSRQSYLDLFDKETAAH